MIKVVIQCCATKRKEAGFFSLRNGKMVTFVAQPDLCPRRKGVACFKPDDVNPDTGGTWREYLVKYNKNADNPKGLLKAGDLYRREVYQLLARDSRWETYILSAGWGLVSSDFLLPPYDISFSKRIPHEWKIRYAEDTYRDFNQLAAKKGDTVYFFGGMDYLEPFYKLSRVLPARKVIYHRANRINKLDGYEYRKYNVEAKTNWHYKCVEDFVNGRIPL